MNDAVVANDLCETPNVSTCDMKPSFTEWINSESRFGSVLVIQFIYKAMKKNPSLTLLCTDTERITSHINFHCSQLAFL